MSRGVILLLLIVVVGAGMAIQQGWVPRENVPDWVPGVDAIAPEPAASVAAASQGVIYEWKDAKGRRHFGNEVPAGVKAKPADLPGLTIMPSGTPAEEKPAEKKLRPHERMQEYFGGPSH